MRAPDAAKEKLQYCFDATLKLKESDTPDLAAQAEVRFPLALADASHTVVVLHAMRGFFDLMQSSVMHSRQRMYTVPTIFSRLTEQQNELLEAILAGDPERATKAAKSHLGFDHSTIKNLHEDEARQARITRLPDEETNVTREGNP